MISNFIVIILSFIWMAQDACQDQIAHKTLIQLMSMILLV